MDIPAGIVAALALWPTKSDGTQHAQYLTDFLAAQPAPTWPGTVREVTAVHWVRRPDLISTAAPILRWAEDEHSPDMLYAIRAVALTALKHGVLLHTGASDPAMRSDTDLMSWTITALRHRGDRAWLGEFHTPPEIAEAMNRIAIGDNPPTVSSLYECAGGTGGMFRVAAQHLRERNVDPRRWTWHLEELDPLAAAGAAVNFLIWDLGPKATVARGDILSQPDLYARSCGDRTELDELRDRLVGRAATAVAHLRVLRTLEDLGICAPRPPAGESSQRAA
ncbi:N-6 DNA methylase [Streptomyces sp. NPDC059835]|uniref:N-6 DNA methylase n=1 Tax=Streptomyces sp. NPDC059835 TaxID=3346967 RepID=UPI00365EB4AC